MNNNVTMIIVLVILIIMSGFFSATETAFSSLNKIRLKNLANNGNRKANTALELVDNYDKLLSTILIGNNIVNIISASLSTIIFVNYFGDAGITISTIVMTILVLIFGEISPKTLAKEAPEAFAMFSGSAIKFLIFLLTPLNFFFILWQGLISKIFKTDRNRTITEEELITLVKEAEEEGGIDAQEGELIRSAIEFNDLEVTDVLTPRVDISAVSNEDTKEKISDVFFETGFSRLPVYKDTIDNIIGVINQKDFHNYVDRRNVPIETIIKPTIYTTNSMKISKLLKLLQQAKSHIAVITDEYGGTLGIVTMEDIIEELVGEIWDEHDEVIKDFEKIGEHKYKISCNSNLDKMFELFNLRNQLDISTVSGWVTYELGKIPKVGDSFHYENMNVTVSKIDHRRVLEIEVVVDEQISDDEII